ncbi:MAG TPA: hypothetical protein VJ824_12995 [Bacillota bacterium]|nr:hypothetical protein [Bacillota bacterium]
MIQEQLTLFKKIQKRDWYTQTRERLIEYPSLKDAIAEEDCHDDKEKLQEKVRKVKLIDRALSSLPLDQHKIIELSYFTNPKPPDVDIQDEVGMEHTAFYKQKDKIMRHIATVLNIL